MNTPVDLIILGTKHKIYITFECGLLGSGSNKEIIIDRREFNINDLVKHLQSQKSIFIWYCGCSHRTLKDYNLDIDVEAQFIRPLAFRCNKNPGNIMFVGAVKINGDDYRYEIMN